jgi:hypothetical protein
VGPDALTRVRLIRKRRLGAAVAALAVLGLVPVAIATGTEAAPNRQLGGCHGRVGSDVHVEFVHFHFHCSTFRVRRFHLVAIGFRTNGFSPVAEPGFACHSTAGRRGFNSVFCAQTLPTHPHRGIARGRRITGAVDTLTGGACETGHVLRLRGWAEGPKSAVSARIVRDDLRVRRPDCPSSSGHHHREDVRPKNADVSTVTGYAAATPSALAGRPSSHHRCVIANARVARARHRLHKKDGRVRRHERHLRRAIHHGNGRAIRHKQKRLLEAIQAKTNTLAFLGAAEVRRTVICQHARPVPTRQRG